MRMSAAAAPNASYQWGAAMSKIPRHHPPDQRLQNSNCASLHAESRVQYYGASSQSAASQILRCRGVPQCSAAAASSARCSTFDLCTKDSKLSEGRCVSSNLRKTSLGAMVTAQSSSSTYTARSDRKSAELRSTSYNSTAATKPNPTMPPSTREPQDDEVGVQELTVYEVNQLDRGSPMLLSLSKLAVDWYNRFRVQPLNSLGDVVPFTNKIFDGSLKKRLGITAGIISVMRHYPEQDALLFESIYSFYFGDYGHISVKGPYKTHEDTVLTVTGGSGIFTGVYGTVQIHNVEYPFVLFYKFQLRGIPQLPEALKWDTVPPAKGVRPSRTASMPGFALPNFTD